MGSVILVTDLYLLCASQLFPSFHLPTNQFAMYHYVYMFVYIEEDDDQCIKYLLMSTYRM